MTHDELAAGLYAANGFLVIQARQRLEIGHLLYPATRQHRFAEGDTLVMRVIAESTKAEFLSQHRAPLPDTDNYFNPDWHYFYRVEAAD